MDTLMNSVMVGTAVVAGLVLVAVGAFSIASLLVGDLLETSEPAEHNFSRAA
ncbi:MAG TPA: hypothetical protein VK011_08395 [Acidimicrobiia bacterium]|nr:hypothetical protein [Acidimicrobiia bacterium]